MTLQDQLNNSSAQSPVQCVGFVGPSNMYLKFLIDPTKYHTVIVAHEGDWTGSEAMACHRHYPTYEAVQAWLGNGFRFRGKEYVRLIDRSLFKFEWDSSVVKSSLFGFLMTGKEFERSESSIAIPATGEEVWCEIYGEENGRLYLLWEGEA